MGKQNVVYTHNKILFNLKKKKGNSDACYSIDEPEATMLSEMIKLSQKDKYRMIPLMWGTYSSQFIEIESRMVDSSAGGRGIGELLFNGDRVSVTRWKSCLIVY